MFNFKKQERLCSTKEINNLFSSGNAFLHYPLSVKYIHKESPCPIVKVLIVAPKRYHKLAVSRNKIKRLIREAYRLNKLEINSFAKENNIEILFSISYVSQEIMTYNQISDVVKKSLKRIIKETKQKLEKDIQTHN